MKKVIAEEVKRDVVRICEISEKKFYGQENINYNARCFIVPDKNGKCLALTPEEAVEPDYSHFDGGASLTAFIKSNLLNRPYINIYEFDSFEEICKWVCETRFNK